MVGFNFQRIHEIIDLQPDDTRHLLMSSDNLDHIVSMLADEYMDVRIIAINSLVKLASYGKSAVDWVGLTLQWQ